MSYKRNSLPTCSIVTLSYPWYCREGRKCAWYCREGRIVPLILQRRKNRAVNIAEKEESALDIAEKEQSCHWYCGEGRKCKLCYRFGLLILINTLLVITSTSYIPYMCWISIWLKCILFDSSHPLTNWLKGFAFVKWITTFYLKKKKNILFIFIYRFFCFIGVWLYFFKVYVYWYIAVVYIFNKCIDTCKDIHKGRYT